MQQNMTLPRVLTIEETASYLRLPQETIERQAIYGKIPGRLIDNTWRFFRPAIEEWLASRDSRTILLQQAGALADDDTLPELLANIYKERGRPECEEESHS